MLIIKGFYLTYLTIYPLAISFDMTNCQN